MKLDFKKQWTKIKFFKKMFCGGIKLKMPVINGHLYEDRKIIILLNQQQIS